MSVRVKKLVPHATIPTRGSAKAAGVDLFAAEPVIIPAHGKALVSTGIAICSEETGVYFRIAPRSGMAVRDTNVMAGVVDEDYRGEIKVLLRNFAAEPFVVSRGDRVAQLIVEKIAYLEFREGDLDDTARGAAGFGSTGV